MERITIDFGADGRATYDVVKRGRAESPALASSGVILWTEEDCNNDHAADARTVRRAMVEAGYWDA